MTEDRTDHKWRSAEYRYSEYWKKKHHDHPGSLLAVGYAELGDGFNRVAYRLRLAAMRRLLERNHVPPIANVLEAGVGVGAYGSLWKALGVQRWVGVDISVNAVRALEERFPGACFRVADVADPGFTEKLGSVERFRLVAVVDVLYHLLDDESFLRSIRNLSACVDEGGYLVCTDIFVQQACLSAPHVKRRPLEQYADVLREEKLAFVDREKVFAILGDPLPRSGVRGDWVLFQVWRVLSKVVRTIPGNLRGPIGGVLAFCFTPADAILRRLATGDGVNLEIALFRRLGGEPT